MDTSKLVLAYVRIRDARADLKREYDQKDAELQEKLDKIEAVLLDMAKEHGLDSMKTPYGTATKTVRTRYWAPDWDAYVKFLKSQGDDGYDLVERRIHQGNFKEFLENNPDVAPPVNADSRYSIVVRRGNKS
jgi:hypothetical protein